MGGKGKQDLAIGFNFKEANVNAPYESLRTILSKACYLFIIYVN